MSEVQDEKSEEAVIPEYLPLLPIRDSVYFPHSIFPLFVGRDKSVRALEEARAQDRYILLVAQRQMAIDDPVAEDIYDVGTVAEVMQVLNLPDGTVRVMLEGQARVRIPRASARSAASRITGPSASGSENGKPISTMSAPASTAARASSGVSGTAIR